MWQSLCFCSITCAVHIWVVEPFGQPMGWQQGVGWQLLGWVSDMKLMQIQTSAGAGKVLLGAVRAKAKWHAKYKPCIIEKGNFCQENIMGVGREICLAICIKQTIIYIVVSHSFRTQSSLTHKGKNISECSAVYESFCHVENTLEKIYIYCNIYFTHKRHQKIIDTQGSIPPKARHHV